MENSMERGLHQPAVPFFSFQTPYFVLVLFLSFYSLHITASGQKLGKYYTATMLENGTLYYLFPMEDFREAENKSPLVFDISYLSSRDSAILNFSYFHSFALPADHLALHFGDTVITSYPVRKLFVEVEKKNRWHHRYSSTIHMADLDLFFQSGQTPEIIITAKDMQLRYLINKSKWNRRSRIFSLIIQVIRANL